VYKSWFYRLMSYLSMQPSPIKAQTNTWCHIRKVSHQHFGQESHSINTACLHAFASLCAQLRGKLCVQWRRVTHNLPRSWAQSDANACKQAVFHTVDRRGGYQSQTVCGADSVCGGFRQGPVALTPRHLPCMQVDQCPTVDTGQSGRLCM
jgi:hypothetical protein